MFIQSPPDSTETKKVYQSSAAGQGFVMNLTRAWAWRPEVFEGFAALRNQLTQGSSLTKRDLATLVCAMAAELGDAYCALAWGCTLAHEADADVAAAVIGNGNANHLNERDHALAVWARKMVADPNGTRASDVQALRDVGFGDREIFEITAFVAFRLAFSTVNDALGIEADAALLDKAPAPLREAVRFGRLPSA